LISKKENILIKAQNLTEVESIVGQQVPAAILLNCDDWGFGHFILDETAIQLFEQKLGRVQSKIDRAVVIGQVISMMRQVEYPATRMPSIMNQLMDEQNQNLINALFGAFVMAQSQYLPIETVPKFNKETATFFLKKAKKEAPNNEDLTRFCIDKALTFASSQEHLKLTSSWIMDGQVKIEDEEIKIDLTQP